MACVAVTSLMRTLELEFLQSNPRLILQDKQLIMSLYEKLGFLQTFLDESEKKADDCEELNHLIAKIRGVAFGAEYNIEATLVKICHQTLHKTLRRVLEDVEKLMEMTKDLQIHEHPKSLYISSGGQSFSQHTSKFEDAMVGQAKEFEEFKGHLLISSNNKLLQVMTLVGMGGIGKTTFARRVYDDSIVKSHFDCCGWATMSQEHNERQVLLELCRSMCDDINTQKDGEPAEQLRRSLLGRRYLIVLDDIWTTEAWDDVKRCFPEENTGSAILLTTRLKEVADYAGSGKLSHDMRFLDSDESWNLFYQKLLVKECLDEGLEAIGRNIVRKCHGLPLTIVVLAGHLSTNMAIDEWKNVESMLNSLTNLDLSEQFSRILTLSYNNLPCHLKSCFLYLGAFPEDSEIEIKKVIRLWIAEGFINETSQMTLEDLGEVYLHELINRSLIMISVRGCDGKIKTCRMHDILHDLCVSKAKKDKLLHMNHKGFLCEIRFNNTRWLSVKIVNSVIKLIVDLNIFRSILCFDMITFPGRTWDMEATSFKMIRVLDLSVICYSGSIPLDIMEVVLLRYLALPSNRLLTSIPVRKNKNLQTLVVCEDMNGNQELPHGIWELPRLRHLELHHQLSIYNPEEVQLNLQTMYWLHSFQCTEQVFLRIPNVKELGIIGQGIRHDDDHCFLHNLNCLNQLEKLKVQGTYCPIQLPVSADSFPQNLKNITFSKTLVPWEAMSIISMLPNLEVLKLKNHACLGQEWELTEEDGFQRLKLLLISVTDLNDWKAGDVGNPFPVLEHLVLRNCFKLKEMPSWIDSINMLKSIQFEHCYTSLVSSARMIEEEQRECYGEEYGFEILEFQTQSDEDWKNSEIEEDHENSDVQSVWIEARKLCIAWVDNPTHWLWIRDSEHEAVELLGVSWLDIIGIVDTNCLCKMTSYSAYLVFKFKSDAYGLDTARTSVKYLKDKKSNSDENQRFQVFVAKSRCFGDSGRFPNSRHDGWMEIMLGNFYVSSGNEGEVEMRFWNTENKFFKYGLIVRGIEVRSN